MCGLFMAIGACGNRTEGDKQKIKDCQKECDKINNNFYSNETCTCRLTYSSVAAHSDSIGTPGYQIQDFYFSEESTLQLAELFFTTFADSAGLGVDYETSPTNDAFNSLALTRTNSGGVTHVAVESGEYRDATGNVIGIETASPILYHDGYLQPFAGVLVLSGSNGATAEVRVLSDNVYQLLFRPEQD